MKRENILLILILSTTLITLSANAVDLEKNYQRNVEESPAIEYQELLVKEIDLENQKILSNNAFQIVDDYFEINSLDSLEYIDLPYERLYITLMSENSLRCSWGSELEGNKDYLRDAIIGCIEDERFGGVFQQVEIENMEIIFNFLYNRKRVRNFEEEIELGIHAIEIEKDGKKTWFKESVPITKNYGLEKTLQRLCKKRKLKKDCTEEKNTKVHTYESFTFKTNRKTEIKNLFRYNLQIEKITNSLIYDRIELSKKWFLNNINPNNQLLEYEYYPSKNQYKNGNNHIRQLGSLWSMTELKKFINTEDLDSLIHREIYFYLANGKCDAGICYVEIEEKATIGHNAFLILSLINTDYEAKSFLLNSFAKGILETQLEDGSYATNFNSDEVTGIDFYPGEAMLALMKLYEFEKDERYLESVKKAYPYYRNYWRSNKNTAFIPWHTQADFLLYKQTKNPEIADFIFEMNDWLIDKYQIKNSAYPDLIGAFTKENPRSSTSSYLEGITDAYELAIEMKDTKHIEKYEDSIKSATNWLLLSQYTPENTFYLKNPDRAIGGFRKSLTKNNQRNDYTQHALMALKKIYKLNLFDSK